VSKEALGLIVATNQEAIAIQPQANPNWRQHEPLDSGQKTPAQGLLAAALSHDFGPLPEVPIPLFPPLYHGLSDFLHGLVMYRAKGPVCAADFQTLSCYQNA
jgi:hypothetical protein